MLDTGNGLTGRCLMSPARSRDFDIPVSAGTGPTVLFLKAMVQGPVSRVPVREFFRFPAREPGTLPVGLPKEQDSLLRQRVY